MPATSSSTESAGSAACWSVTAASRVDSSTGPGAVSCQSASRSPSANSSRVGPSATFRPSSITTVRGAYRVTVSMLWVTITTVSPASRLSSATRSMNWRCWAASSPVVGSSKTITSGSVARMLASATRWRCPFERLNGSAVSNPSSSTVATASATARSSSSPLRPKFSGPKATSLRTVSAKIWWSGFWNT